ncbi:MAG: hypothetical protein QXQ80_00280 [Nitrososphaerota archaeon]
MKMELFLGWDIIVILGVIITLMGLAMALMKKRGGLLALFVGLGWLISFGIYLALLQAGIYGKVAAEASYIPNIIGLILVALGIGVWIKIPKKGVKSG